MPIWISDLILVTSTCLTDKDNEWSIVHSGCNLNDNVWLHFWRLCLFFLSVYHTSIYCIKFSRKVSLIALSVKLINKKQIVTIIIIIILSFVISIMNITINIYLLTNYSCYLAYRLLRCFFSKNLRINDAKDVTTKSKIT